MYLLNRQRARIVAALALTIAFALPLHARSGAIQVNGYVIDGQTVRIELANSGTAASSATVQLEVALGDSKLGAASSVERVEGKSSTSITFSFPAPVTDIIVLGISENNEPV